MRLPEEVYRANGKGAPRAEGELTHEERRRRRAQHKRAFKAKSQQQVWPSFQSTGGRAACFVLMAAHLVCCSWSLRLSCHVPYTTCMFSESHHTCHCVRKAAGTPGEKTTVLSRGNLS